MKHKIFALALVFGLLIVGGGYLNAQQREVSGTVVAKDDGSPVAGATIMVKGTRQGTAADENGKFVLTNVKDNAVLVFSFIGMTTQEVALNGRAKLDVVMESEGTALDEVMVVAYGTATRQSITGSVSAVDTKKIEKRLTSVISGALEGAAPGVQVNNTMGTPGSAPGEDPEIRIRGFSTINGNKNPLYVVDGVPQPLNATLADWNSNDIESITVLKDASSAALYGNRAANGVILITTKSAKGDSKPVVTFTVKQGVYTRGRKEYERLGIKDWMETEWIGLKNYRLTTPSKNYTEDEAKAYATEKIIPGLVKKNIFNAADDKLFDSNGKLIAQILPGYTDLDWSKELERNGHRQEYGVSYAASGEKYSVYASLGYLKEIGYFIGTDFERYSGRINSDFKPAKWFKGGLNLGGSFQNRNAVSVGGFYYGNAPYVVRFLPPVYPIYEHNADGSFVLDESGNRVYDLKSSYLSGYHPIYSIKNDEARSKTLTLDANAFATFILPYGFEATIKASENYKSNNYRSFSSPEFSGKSDNGELYVSDGHYQTTTFQQQITWNHDYGKHHVDALLGHESYEYTFDTASADNVNMGMPGAIVLGNFTTNIGTSGSKDTDATESYLARARYNYDNKYYFDASFRRDGTSRFHKDNRWGSFYSFGAAWDITKENFMQEVYWVDYLKLRASYGEVGNNYSNFYAYQALYASEKNAGQIAFDKKQLLASDIKWETTQTIDVAVESRLFDRLNLNVGYFNKKSKDLLFSVPLPMSAGTSTHKDENFTQLKNIGDIVNRGWEIAADVDIIRSNGWRWNVGMDATIMKNEIKKLPNGEDIDDDPKRYSEGHSIYEWYTYHFVGVDQMTGNSLYTLDPTQEAKAAANNALVEINGTKYTTRTNYGLRDWRGSVLPKVYGSIHTDASWKGITLNVLMTYSIGGKIQDDNYQTLMSAKTSVRALHKDVLKSWNGVPSGMTETSANRIDPNGIPVVNPRLSSYNNARSDRWLTNGSYLVMKNITLSYTLPSKWMRAWGLQELTVNAGIENAFTITKRRGIDPQMFFSGTQNAVFVTPRIFNFGLTLKF